MVLSLRPEQDEVSFAKDGTGDPRGVTEGASKQVEAEPPRGPPAAQRLSPERRPRAFR